jgi:multiple sugar transport system substrate-binding protein
MRHKKISRRDFLRSGAAVVASIPILAACQPKATEAPKAADQPTQAPPKAETVNIRISVWGDVPDKAAYDDIIAMFNESQSSVKATTEQYLGGYYEKIKANFAGNTSADVLYYQGWSWQPFAQEDLLVPVDDLIERDNFTKPWPDLQVHNNYAKWHGHTYMSPADSGAVIMFYNKELFDKKGVPYPTDDWTFADFQDAVEKLSFEEGGTKYYGYAQAGGWNGQYTRSVHWIRKDGVFEWDTISEPREALFTQPEIIDALQYTIYDVIDKGYCPSPSMIAGGGVTIATGVVAMTMEGPWFLPNMHGEQAAKEGGVSFDVVLPPLGASGIVDTELSTSGHVISGQSKNPEAAWELVKFIADDEGQERIAQGGRQCGTPDMMKKHWVPNIGETFNFQNAEAFLKAMSVPTAHGIIVGGAGANFDAFSSAEGGMGAAWEAMVGVQKTAKEALEELNPKLQKMLDEYWAKQGG